MAYKRKEQKSFTCACGCRERYTTNRYRELPDGSVVPLKLYKSKAHNNRVYNRNHPRQKIGRSLALEVLPDGTVKLPAGRYVLRRLP